MVIDFKPRRASSLRSWIVMRSVEKWTSSAASDEDITLAPIIAVVDIDDLAGDDVSELLLIGSVLDFQTN